MAGAAVDGKLLAKGEDLELERRSAPDGRNYHIYEGPKDGSHARDAMPVWPETSMDSGTDGVFIRDRFVGGEARGVGGHPQP